MSTAPSTIRTFSDARAVLAAHGKEPKPFTGGRMGMWTIDGVTPLDKGGVIIAAKALAGKEIAAPAGATTPAAADALPPRGNPETQAPDLIAYGWTFEDVSAHQVTYHGAEQPTSRAINAWKIENRLLNLPFTTVYAHLDGAILEARRQQAQAVGYIRPEGVPEHTTVRTWSIVSGRWQPRTTFDPATLEELAESIKSNGLLNPPLVFWNERGQYELIAGERRWRAVQMAGIEELPVQVMQGTPEQLQAAAVLDNAQRENLSPVEEGAAYERLIKDLGVSENELSRLLGKPRTYIQTRRAIANAAPEIHQALATGTLSITHARAIAAGAPGDHASQAKAAAEVIDMVKTGQRVSEEIAQQKVERAVLTNHKKALLKLGWKIDEPGQYSSDRPHIYSKADRPRAWTGGEILDVVRNGARPGETSVTPAVLTPEIRVLLARRSHNVSETFAPWLKLSTTPPRFMDGDELTRFAAEIEAECDALEARFTIAGWTLTFQQGETAYWSAQSHLHRIDNGYSFNQALRFIARIESGEVTAEPQPNAGRVELKRACCAGCKQEFAFNSLEYVGGGDRCKECVKEYWAQLAATRAASRAASRAAVESEAGSWIEAAPDRMLRLILMRLSDVEGFPQLYSLDARVKKIRSLGRADLQGLLRSFLVEQSVALKAFDLGAETPLNTKEASA